MNRINQAIDKTIALGDQLLEAAKWDADTVREHIEAINGLSPAWRSAVRELRAAHEAAPRVDLATCTRCGTVMADYRLQGEEKLCICCVSDLQIAAGRDAGMAEARAMLLESAWEDGDEWAASTRDCFEYAYTGATRDEVIADATASADRDDSTIYVTQIEWIDPARCFDASSILEHADEFLWDNWSVEDVDVDVTDEAKDELQALLNSWARRHIGRTVWEGVRKTEEIDIDWCPGDCGELATECRCAHQAALGVLGSRLFELLGAGWEVAAAKEGARVSDEECLGVLVKAKVEQLLELGVTMRRRGGEQ